MELKKRSGTCTEETFWEVISEIDWENNQDTSVIKRACLIAWAPEFGASFRKILDKKEGEVGRALEKYEDDPDEQRDYYLGDDGFGDMCSHVVGLGRETFEAEVADPKKLVKRAQKSDYVECFSYGIPYEARPDMTWEKWSKLFGYGMTEKEFNNDYRLEDRSETFEEHMESQKRAFRDYQLGDWALLDPDHYASMAKYHFNRLMKFKDAIAEDEGTPSTHEIIALDFVTLLILYFKDLVDGRTNSALAKSESAMHAWWGAHHVAVELGEIKQKHIEFLTMVGKTMYSGENLINDHRRYMGGKPAFKCKHHLKEFRESVAKAG